MATNLRREILYLPNLITFGRILLIPAVLAFIDNESAARSFVAMLLFGLSAISDIVDGYLARRLGRVSLLGKFFDPLADKLLVMATLVWMVPLGRIEPWVVVLLLAREISITALRGVASAEGLVIAAGGKGKTKTALQLAGIACLIVHFPYPLLFTGLVVDFNRIGTWVVYISLVFSLGSAVEYVQMFARAVQEDEQRE